MKTPKFVQLVMATSSKPHFYNGGVVALNESILYALDEFGCVWVMTKYGFAPMNNKVVDNQIGIPV